MTLFNPSPGDEYMRELKMAATAWFMPGMTFVTLQSPGGVRGANTIYYQPMFFPEDVAVDRVGLQVGIAGGAACGCRLFEFDRATGQPGALIENFGDFNTTVIGDKEIVISRTFTRGYYFGAIRDTAGSLQLVRPTYPQNCCGLQGFSSDPGNYSYPSFSVVAAWADPAPTPDTVGNLDNFVLYFRRA